MFSDELEKISWEETTKAIYSKTEADVIRALGKSRCDVDDFMALISPAAEKFLEPMARLSKKYTEERFGRTISMFIPLYITNSCTNSCVYCGFHISNPMARTILTPEEIANEYKAIKKPGPVEHLLIVTGENPDNPYEVTFYHIADGDVNGYWGYGIVAFKLDKLPATEGKTVDLTLKWKSYNGARKVTFKYCTRKSSTASAKAVVSPSEYMKCLK